MFSIQTWLGESEDSKKSNGTPGYFSVGMSGMFFLSSSLYPLLFTLSFEEALEMR